MKKVFTVFILLFVQFCPSQIFVSEGTYIYAEKESLFDSVITTVQIDHKLSVKISSEKNSKKSLRERRTKHKSISGKLDSANKSTAGKKIEKKEFPEVNFKDFPNTNNHFQTTKRNNYAVTSTPVFKVIDIAVTKYLVNQDYDHSEVKILNSKIFHFFSQPANVCFSVRPPPLFIS
ncbi:hypothetical protein [Chryseobacterium gambrini]|uniref:hypothetical protein n=1 Tax=Chryseobacterium gambrini TaxID=373672 RepID=UPI003BA53E7B